MSHFTCVSKDFSSKKKKKGFESLIMFSTWNPGVKGRNMKTWRIFWWRVTKTDPRSWLVTSSKRQENLEGTKSKGSKKEASSAACEAASHPERSSLSYFIIPSAIRGAILTVPKATQTWRTYRFLRVTFSACGILSGISSSINAFFS